ncbi:MAG: hypothetical protein RL120_00475, partial [Gammaproteobacteria bacterium]
MHRIKLVCFSISLMFGSVTAHGAEGEWQTLIDGAEGLDNFNIVGDADWAARMNSIMATSG